jgi:hypothetical protein
MRDNGYYWIKQTEDSEWEVSHYLDGSFAIFYSEFAFFTDSELFEIDENRIIR